MNEPDLGPQLRALEALCAETLTHDLGWHFLRLGSRIERARSIVFLADELLLPEREPGEPVPPPSEFRMRTLLHFTDCLFTYRSLYPGEFQPASILSWLIEAPENPRGLRYQAEKIAEHVSVLPEDLAPHAVSALRSTAFRLLAAAKQIDTVSLTTSPHRAGEFLGTAQTLLTELNERLTQVYFSHSDIPDSGW
jgi:uncharacterized alpha-E superfamily protein